MKAVALAKVYEEKHSAQKANLNTKTPTPNTTTSHTRAHFNPTKSQFSEKQTPPILNTPLTRPMNLNQKNPNIRRISPAEMQLRKEKGLCYFCDDKFSFTHKCPNKHLMLLQVDDGDTVETIEPNPPDIPQT